MTQTVETSQDTSLDPAADESGYRDAIERNEAWNLAVLAGHIIAQRIGWVFKTESVIIPAFLDSVAGAGWMRGLLPVLNRFGQSVPPAVFAGRLRRMRRKRKAFLWCSLAMSVPFLAMSWMCYVASEGAGTWVAWTFLGLYGVYFCCIGLHQMSYGTMQGKLIRPTRRGRLLWLSSLLGSMAAVVATMMLLPQWLAMGGVGFAYIFGFAGVWFAISASAILALREPSDGSIDSSEVEQHFVADAWRVLRTDANFRRLAVVAAFFSVALMFFPHYQALARERLGLGGVHLMYWVVVQNVTVGLSSLLVGPLADRRGTRLTLRTLIFLLGFAPVVAVIVATWGGSFGAGTYWVVFVLVGLVPVTMRTLMNYTLEICEPAEHPRYLSTVGLCLAAPFVLSPGVGWLIDRVGFGFVFLVGAGLIFTAAAMTWRLAEPRHVAGQIVEPTE